MAIANLQKLIMPCTGMQGRGILASSELLMRKFAVNTGKEDITSFEEVTIPVPWGHIAGKLYGPKNVRPIVGVHGWQENAGTFDTLVPFLPRNISFLAVDLPGHGRSSWLPPGMCYHALDNIAILLRIMDTFKWEKISLLCHSMSSINGFLFTAFFPDKVDMMIGLDCFKPMAYSSDKIIGVYQKNLKNSMAYEKYNTTESSAEPPCYEWDQLVERLHDASKKSINKEVCKFLLERGIQPSQHHPQKYYFSRDNRLKNMVFYSFPQDFSLELARRISSPFMFIKALQSVHGDRDPADALEILQRNANFEYHEVDGTHHVHLNNPERVAPFMISFIKKWSGEN